MKEVKIILALFMLLFIVQSVSAVKTEVKIKTMPNHEVQATAYNPSKPLGERKYGSFRNISDEYGDFSFVFSSNDPEYNLIIFIYKDGEKVNWEGFSNPETYRNNLAGEPLYLEIAPSWFEFIETPTNNTNVSEQITNDTAEENLSIAEEEVITEDNLSAEFVESRDDKISGSTIFGKKGVISTKIIYYIIIVFAVLVIVFVVLAIVKKRLPASDKKIKIKKLSDVNKEKDEKISDYKKMIDDAEKKIEEAQQEIRKLKNTERIREHEKKIEEAKKKLQEDERELLRLRRGED